MIIELWNCSHTISTDACGRMAAVQCCSTRLAFSSDCSVASQSVAVLDRRFANFSSSQLYSENRSVCGCKMWQVRVALSGDLTILAQLCVEGQEVKLAGTEIQERAL